VSVQRRFTDRLSELRVRLVELPFDLMENALFLFGERHSSYSLKLRVRASTILRKATLYNARRVDHR
jgi:hypothetical protein